MSTCTITRVELGIIFVCNLTLDDGRTALDTRGAGFEAQFLLVPRLANMLVSDTPFTSMHFAIAILEYQGADISQLTETGQVESWRA